MNGLPNKIRLKLKQKDLEVHMDQTSICNEKLMNKTVDKEKIIEVLNKLIINIAYKLKNETDNDNIKKHEWRLQQLKIQIYKLQQCTIEIISGKQVLKLGGFSPRMADYIDEIINTGTLKELDGVNYNIDPKYERTQIYKIVCPKSDQWYVGYTTLTLNKYYASIVSKYKAWDSKNYPHLLQRQFEMFELFGIDNCMMISVENYPCKCEEAALQRVDYWRKQTGCINPLPPNTLEELAIYENINCRICKVPCLYTKHLKPHHFFSRPSISNLID